MNEVYNYIFKRLDYVDNSLMFIRKILKKQMRMDNEIIFLLAMYLAHSTYLHLKVEKLEKKMKGDIEMR